MCVRRCVLLIGLLTLTGSRPAAAEQLNEPAYQIVLRSRQATVTPMRSKGAQTGGGSIIVEQPEPNTIIVTMAGSAMVGSQAHPSRAAIDFALNQDLEIVPLRPAARPPRIGMIGRVVGMMQVTHPGHSCKPCGMADQGPATAGLMMGEECLLSVNVQPNAAICGQEVAINHRDGPVECLPRPAATT